jgi:hypothetical protein
MLDFHFYIFSFGYSVFLYFFCTQEQQRVPSLPISLIRGDGDAAINPISGGDVPISELDQQGRDMVLKYFQMLAAFFLLQIVAGTNV